MTNNNFYRKEQEMKRVSLNPSNMCDKIKSHTLHISSSLITANRILTYFSTVIMFIVSFYLIEKHLPYMMAFLAFLGVLCFIFDVLQNIVALKYEK